MGLLDGLFGGQQLQAQAPGQGLLGGFGARMSEMQRTNPEAFIALGAGLLQGDVAKGAAGMGQAIGSYRDREANAGLQREGWDRQDARFDKSFGLDQQRLNATLQAQGSERAQAQAVNNATFNWLKTQGAPEPILQMAQAGAGREAMATWQTLNSRPDLQFKTLPDGTYGTFNDQSGEFAPLGSAPKPPSNGITIGPDGSVQIGGPMRESEAKANIYASRMEASNNVLQGLEGEGTDLQNKLMSGVPVVGNYGLTPEYRQYEQAQRDFLNATLRQESGAVISPEEFENGKRQYFPQPGDDPATIAQKARNRETAIRAIRQASGQPAPSIIGAERPMTGSEAFRTMSDAELEAIANGE